jgi:hypothetical protein
MKMIILGAVLLAAAGTVVAAEGEDEKPRSASPVVEAPPRDTTPTRYRYEQQTPPGSAPLVKPEQAQSIIDRFRQAFPEPGQPRFLIFVNRELVEETGGLALTSRRESTVTRRRTDSSDVEVPAAGAGRPNVTVTAGGNVTVNAADALPGKGEARSESEEVRRENRYRMSERPERKLADRQTVRDVERLFGRPLRMGGAALVDQRVAMDLIGERSLEDFLTASDQAAARKDREAIRRIADVVLEVLISSRDVTVTGLAADRVYQVPDLQVTAIRLEDFQIIGQATSSDVMGQGGSEGMTARNHAVPEITEATALALMEDMLISAP